MLYTICPRNKAGAYSQKFMIDSDFELAVLVARHTFIDNGVYYVEIYEGRAPIMDCWGKPKLFVYRDNVSETRIH
jgi:hypothetical protein